MKSTFSKSPQDFPDALQSGEGPESPDHRVGETTGNGPEIDDVDPEPGSPGSKGGASTAD